MLAAGLVATVSAQSSPAAQAARQWRQKHERAIVEEFMALLAIPNVSRDTANIQRNADTIRDALIKRGVAARLVSVPGANPVVFGEIRTPGATRTIGFMHTTTASRWIRRNGRRRHSRRRCATGRSRPEYRHPAASSGNAFRAPVAHLRPRCCGRQGADHRAVNRPLCDPCRRARAQVDNIKFMFEGEEEAGSPNLMPIWKQTDRSLPPTSG